MSTMSCACITNGFFLPLLVRALELAEDPRGEARRDQRTRPPQRRLRATVGLDERCRVLARGQVLAADVPVEEEVAAQLQTRLARWAIAALGHLEERVERCLKVAFLG